MAKNVNRGSFMPIVLLLFALFVPRVVLICLWLFTNWFYAAFQTLVWPVLGFIFMPLTVLWYSVVMHYYGGQWTAIPMVVMVLAVLLDMSQSRWGRRRTTRPVVD